MCTVSYRVVIGLISHRDAGAFTELIMMVFGNISWVKEIILGEFLYLTQLGDAFRM